ncbi:MAG: hypothetical protein GC191_11795 [Azospirillum sp.]|nr:hypothetical protein [Azospirillum sp.]
MRKLIMALILAALFVLPLGSAPASAQTQLQGGQVYNVANIRNMPLEQWAAIGIGAVAGAVVVESVFQGGLFSLAGAVAGGLIGNWYYEERYWPF